MWPGAWSGRSQRWRGSMAVAGVTGFDVGGDLRAMADLLPGYSTSLSSGRHCELTTGEKRLARGRPATINSNRPVITNAWHPDCTSARAMRYHFSGLAGAGMAPLACLMRFRGHDVQGSDRALAQGKSPDVGAQLRAAGITVLPHDGSAVTAGIDRFVHSTAVEATTAEMQAASALGLTRVPRPALLAEIVHAGKPGVAVAGT